MTRTGRRDLIRSATAAAILPSTLLATTLLAAALGGTALANTMLASTLLAGAVLATAALTGALACVAGAAALAVFSAGQPLLGRVVALRARASRTAFLRITDPDAPGRTRARAPSAA